MLLCLKHEERIGKFIQYLLENDFNEVQLSFDDEVSSVNYLVAANTKRGDFFWRLLSFCRMVILLRTFLMAAVILLMTFTRQSKQLILVIRK